MSAKEDVHPEYERPTPENWDDWSDDQLEEYRERAERELESEARENIRELSADAREARDALLADVESRKDTQEVTLSHDGVEDEIVLSVSTTLSGMTERRVERIQGSDTVEDVLPVIVRVFEDVVETDGYDNPAVWEHIYNEAGGIILLDYLEAVLEPAMEVMESVDGFREDGPRSAPP